MNAVWTSDQRLECIVGPSAHGRAAVLLRSPDQNIERKFLSQGKESLGTPLQKKRGMPVRINLRSCDDICHDAGALNCLVAVVCSSLVVGHRK